MNNSAFKANVHLNIISLASLFFPCKSIGREKNDPSRLLGQFAVVEVHFVNMQTLMGLHFLSSQVSLFVRRFHVKVQNDICVFFQAS